MKGLLVVVALLVVSGVVGMLVTRAMTGRNLGPGGTTWRISEHPRHGRVRIELLPPGPGGADTIVVAELDPAAEDFEYALEEARAEAAAKVIALNNRVLGS